MNKNRFILEIEVKVSKSDFRADFKKRKHEHYEKADILPPVRYGIRFPNYFYFAVPEGLISPSEIPEKYGLIYVNPNRSFEPVIVVKKAKLLHKQKAPEKVNKQFAHLLSYRMIKLLKEDV